MVLLTLWVGIEPQNSYEELWALLDWARPGALGEFTDFREYYAKPLKEGQQCDVDPYTLGKVGTAC
jgi:SNF2 family DNA or RNA helicase